MIVVGCAGFPVPATRYFKEFSFTEVADCTPGSGTVRRWKREAPKSFSFAVLAPKEIGSEGFKPGGASETALEAAVQLSKELDAGIVVIQAPDDFAASRPNKAAVKEVLVRAKAALPRVVFAASHWSEDDLVRVASDAEVEPALDPLKHGLAKGKIAYYRLPGPAGFKSRYEDPVMEQLGEIVRGMRHDQAHVVFANVDMAQDAKRLMKAIA